MFNDDGDGDDNEHQFSPCTVKCVFLTRFRATQDAKKRVFVRARIENPFMHVVYCLRSEHAPPRHNIIASSSMNSKLIRLDE